MIDALLGGSADKVLLLRRETERRLIGFDIAVAALRTIAGSEPGSRGAYDKFSRAVSTAKVALDQIERTAHG